MDPQFKNRENAGGLQFHAGLGVRDPLSASSNLFNFNSDESDPIAWAGLG